jgi:hypothetical protein
MTYRRITGFVASSLYFLFVNQYSFSLENHGREIISLTHMEKVRKTRNFINLNCLTYMSGYAFIYTNSRLK